tara:strand:+ start:741 stop:4325 length:3585 start_codon:yes stop_codon:yes gene_type:complete
MGNIIGDPFEGFVKSQIETRQRALGQVSKISADNLKYYTTKTPWLRLASSVDLSGSLDKDSVLDRLTAVGVDGELIKGNKLSKAFILQGGAISLKDEREATQEDVDAKITDSVGDTIITAGNARQNAGLNYGNGLFNGAYGWGGTGNRGYVPMPGITSAQTTYYNNGALSKATVKIKCFSKEQFQLLDVLYLRPGYTLLLEFGWSVYLNSNADSNRDGVIDDLDLGIGTIQSMDGFKSAPLNFLLNPGEYKGNKDQYKMLKLIADERAKYSGNYEAVYGKITNFKWSFTTDGSYEVEVKLIGMGSIAESLKLNVTQPSKDKIGNVNENGTTPIKSNKKTYKAWLDDAIGPSAAMRVTEGIENVTSDEASGDSPLEKQLNSWPGSARTEMNQKTGGQLALDEKLADINVWAKAEFKKYQDEEEAVAVSNINNNPLLANRDDTKLNKIFYDVQQSAIAVMDRVGAGTDPDGNPATCSFFYTNGVSNGGFLINNTLTGDTMVGGGQKEGKSVYLKFAIVLKIIQENCNLFSNANEDKVPLIKFDFAQEKNSMKFDTNYMSILPPGFSSNPGKCLVEYSKPDGLLDDGNNTDMVGGVLNLTLLKDQHFLVKNNKYIGRLGNVLLNMRFLAEALANASKDEDGSISVLSYIKTILEGINSSMGSRNNFRCTYDEVSGLFKIYDETPQPGLTTSNIDNFAKLNVFGVKKDQGSFVTNISLDAEIPSNFATMITIGAQSNGNNLQGNSLSFSNYNKGLIDRIIPNKVDFTDSSKNEEEISPLQKCLNMYSEKIYYSSNAEKISPFGAMYLLQGKLDGANASTYNFTPSICSDLTENYSSYIQMASGVLTAASKIPNPFFLPFNLNLELEGLSGMRLFQKFRITDDILPPSYEKDSIDIIVKGINHDIDVQSWKTTIDTISVPRFKEPLPPIEPKTNEVVSPKQQQLKKITEKDEVVSDDPLVVRMRITRLVDDGIATLGIMEVLDENGNLLYALPTSERPFNNNKIAVNASNNPSSNDASCIKTGTYLIRNRNSKKHGDHFAVSSDFAKWDSTSYRYSADGTNKMDRGYILIHPGPSAGSLSSAWSVGCILPGFTFNTTTLNSSGNPEGTGTNYWGGRNGASWKESRAAVDKLNGTLYNAGRPTAGGFELEIKNLDGGLQLFFNSTPVKSFLKQIEDATGAGWEAFGRLGNQANPAFAPQL